MRRGTTPADGRLAISSPLASDWIASRMCCIDMAEKNIDLRATAHNAMQ
jgi:hypothetical protein